MPAGRLGGVRPCKQRSPPFPLLPNTLLALNITARRLSHTKATHNLRAGQFPLYRRYVPRPPHDRSVLESIWARGGLLPSPPSLSLPCAPALSVCLVFKPEGEKTSTPASKEVKVERFAPGKGAGRVFSLLLGTRGQGRRGG